MIRLIRGTVVSTGPLHIILENQGIGYLVAVTSRTGLCLPGTELTLYTHLAVRETALDLYGFPTLEELDVFERLLTIPKIGPKSGLQIMDQANVSLIVEAVRLQDPDHLTKLSGVTKKTAEKIVQTLKGKMDDLATTDTSDETIQSEIYQDAFDTLITLGYNPTAIRQILDGLPHAETTSSLVKDALRLLS